MEIGKLDSDLLDRLILRRTGASRPEVLAGPGIGADCAVLSLGAGSDCVLSTDPITAAPEIIGRLAVHVACNDIAANGAEPVAVLLTLLLPPDATEAQLDEIASQADAAAKALGVSIVGGHTEVTPAVRAPIVSATAIGRSIGKGGALGGVGAGGALGGVGAGGALGGVGRGGAHPAGEAPRAAGADARPWAGGVSGDVREGDRILVTKRLALEGTCILAHRHERELRHVLTDAQIDEAKGMDACISVVKEGLAAARVGVSAMHDITEGGVLGAVWEALAPRGLGARVLMAALPFDPITLEACARLGLDPMRLVSSGSMLIICPQQSAAALARALAPENIPLADIGAVTGAGSPLLLIGKDGAPEPIAPPGADEMYRV